MDHIKHCLITEVFLNEKMHVLIDILFVHVGECPPRPSTAAEAPRRIFQYKISQDFASVDYIKHYLTTKVFLNEKMNLLLNILFVHVGKCLPRPSTAAEASRRIFWHKSLNTSPWWITLNIV